MVWTLLEENPPVYGPPAQGSSGPCSSACAGSEIIAHMLWAIAHQPGEKLCGQVAGADGARPGTTTLLVLYADLASLALSIRKWSVSGGVSGRVWVVEHTCH